MMYLARRGLNDFQAIPEEENQALRLVRLLNQGYTIYSVAPQGEGQILLTKQRPIPGSIIQEPRIVSADFEDDN